MYVLKKNLDTINLEQNTYRDDNDDFEWEYNDSYDYLIWMVYWNQICVLY